MICGPTAVHLKASQKVSVSFPCVTLQNDKTEVTQRDSVSFPCVTLQNDKTEVTQRDGLITNKSLCLNTHTRCNKIETTLVSMSNENTTKFKTCAVDNFEEESRAMKIGTHERNNHQVIAPDDQCEFLRSHHTG